MVAQQPTPSRNDPTQMAPIKIGIIGGSGLYQMEALSDVQEMTVETPFGAPSDALIVGNLEGVPVAFLARHGRGHTLMPSELNFAPISMRSNLLGWSTSYPHQPSAHSKLKPNPLIWSYPISLLTAPKTECPPSLVKGLLVIFPLAIRYATI